MADRNLQIVVGAKDEASAKFKSIGDSIKGSFDKIAVAAGASLAAITAFSIKSAVDFADTGEKIANLSIQTGISAGALSGMKAAADEMGLSVEGVTGGVKKMQINLASMAGDTKKADEALKPLGLRFKDIKDLKPEDQLFKLGDAIAKIQDPTERTAAAVQLFGKSGTELLPFFNEGNASLADMVKHAKDAGVYFDDLSANKAAALDAAFDNMKTSVAGAAQQFAVALAPAITGIVEKITPLLQAVSSWIEKNPELTIQILGVTAAILGLLTIMPVIIGTVGALSTAFLVLAANPIILVIAAIAALVAGLVTAYQTNEKFRDVVNAVWSAVQVFITTTAAAIGLGIKSFMDTAFAIWQKWNEFLTLAQNAWDGISSWVSGSIGTISSTIEVTMNAVKATWDRIWQGMSATVSKIVGDIMAFINSMTRGISSAISTAQSAYNSLQKMSTGASSYGGGLAGAAMSAGASLAGKRAGGGSVAGGSTYLVGEQGPELFTPSKSGSIIPNSSLGGGGTSIIITGNTLLDRDSARKIGDMIMGNLRLQRRLT